MSIKPKLEALIYAAEEPIGMDQLAVLLKDDLLALKSEPIAEAEISQPVADGENAEAQLETVGDQQSPSGKKPPEKSEKAELRALLRPILDELAAEYANENHGIEIREVAGGYRMSTKPEHHDVVRAFAKSLKPPIRLSLQALETLAVIAYKQPVTVPEISDIRGVDASGVIGTLMDRKLITTAGRKAVVGRPMLYKTTKEFLVRFGLKDLQELPSVEEFEKLMGADEQQELFGDRNAPIADATGIPEVPEDAAVEQGIGSSGHQGPSPPQAHLADTPGASEEPSLDSSATGEPADHQQHSEPSEEESGDRRDPVTG